MDFVREDSFGTLGMEEGIVYVSVLSPDPMDAHIFAYKGETWEEIGDKAVGYLCTGEESIYFVNTLGMEIGEKTTAMQSGKKYAV